MNHRNNMKKVESFEQYSNLIKDAKKLHGRLDCNTVLMPKEVLSLIQLEKLYYETRNHGVTFLCRERDFFKGYLHAAEKEPLTFSQYTMPLVVEFLYSSKMAGRFGGLEEKLQDAEFEFYVKNVRTKCTIPEMYKKKESVQQLKQQGICWRTACREDSEFLYQIWKSLDPYDSIIPTEVEFMKMEEKGELICVSKDSRLCGAFRLKEENRKTASMWLVVVKENLRGLGIGKRLHEAAFCVAADRGYDSIWQWSDVKNDRILNTVAKMGFSPDGIESKEYILK